MSGQRILLWSIAGWRSLRPWDTTCSCSASRRRRRSISCSSRAVGSLLAADHRRGEEARPTNSTPISKSQMPSVAEGVVEQTKIARRAARQADRWRRGEPARCRRPDGADQPADEADVPGDVRFGCFRFESTEPRRDDELSRPVGPAHGSCATRSRNGGKIAVLVANSTKENIIDRKGAFQERIGQFADDDIKEGDPLKYTIVGFYEDGGSDEKCAANIREALKQHPDLACIVGMNAQHGPTLLKVLKEDGQLGQGEAGHVRRRSGNAPRRRGRAHFRDAGAGFVRLRLRGGEDPVQLEAGRRGGGPDGRPRAGVLRRRGGEQRQRRRLPQADGRPVGAAEKKAAKKAQAKSA